MHSSNHKLKVVLTVFLITLSHSLFAQQKNVQVVSETTNSPIPFATIQTGKSTGTITNDEGYFSIHQNDTKSITISSIGFQTKTIDVKSLPTTNGVIYLAENINTLDTVYVENKAYNVDSIMYYVQKRAPLNYAYLNKKQQFFYRNTSSFTPTKTKLHVKKKTGLKRKDRKKANKEIAKKSWETSPSYTEVYGEYLNTQLTDTKLLLTKGAIINKSTSEDAVAISSKNALRELLQDTTKTYKVKSGWFKIEDSLSFANLGLDIDKAPNELDVNAIKNDINQMLWDQNFVIPNTLLDFLLEREKYKFTLEETTYYQDNLIHKINFKPRKSSAKFAGTLIVNSDDFGVLKLDYGYADGKRGRNINLKWLLGFKLTDTDWKVSMVNKKNESGTYDLAYLRTEKGRQMYVHRPLKLRENTTKDKLKLDFKTTLIMKEKNEILFLHSETVTPENFNAAQQQEIFECYTMQTYEPSFWDGYNILEPLKAMKNLEIKSDNG